MDLSPSFSQPNVREKQPLNIACSQFYCYTFTNITSANLLGECRMRPTIFGANYSQRKLKFCTLLKPVFRKIKHLAIRLPLLRWDASTQHASTASSILSDCRIKSQTPKFASSHLYTWVGRVRCLVQGPWPELKLQVS